MVTHLYSDFLESGNTYEKVERFWRSLVDEVSAQAGQEGEWREWQPTRFLDGTPVPRDGNPIFNARSTRLRRAVRIIQSPPEQDEVEWAAWISTFDLSAGGGPGFTEELIINLALSEEAAARARQLLAIWMEPSVSRERMEDVIADLQKRDSAGGGGTPLSSA